MSNHRAAKRKLVVIPQQSEEPLVKEDQKRQDTVEHLRTYIAKHCHHLTAEQVAEELEVPLFAVKMQWPNPAR
jgi:hypothetical protein